jgi:protein-tyrosine phosphatase
MEATAEALLAMAGMPNVPAGVRDAMAKALDEEVVTGEDVAVILPGRLWLGNWKLAKVASTQLQLNAVVNCAGKTEAPLEPPPGVVLVRLDMPDSPHPKLDVRPLLLRGVDAIAAHERVGVHCVGGQNRSPSVCAAFLILKHGMAPQAAIDAVTRARPVVQINPIYRAALFSLK